VLLPDNKPAIGAIVYASLVGSQVLSTLVKESGSWIIPLSNIRTADQGNLLEYQERSELTITVRTPAEDAQALTDTLNDSPVPLMIIGKEYDFRKQQAYITPAKSLSTLSNNSSVNITKNVLGSTDNKPINPETNPQKKFNLSILQPVNGSSLVSDRPLFTGTGNPGKKLVLTIGTKEPFTVNLDVSADGKWTYTPVKALNIGKNTLTVTGIDESNKPAAVSHIFNILKSGTQVLGDATPSATLAPTIEITPISTLSGEPPPVSGSPLPFVLLLIIGSILFMGGISAFAFI